MSDADESNLDSDNEPVLRNPDDNPSEGGENATRNDFITFEAVLQKLKTRPPPEDTRAITPCDLLDERRAVKSATKPPTPIERLIIRPQSAIETIYNTIEKPEGTVPPLALPSWHFLPLDQKIPLLPAPAGMMYYSPGKICVKLQREPKLYSVEDPYNRHRIVRRPYSALVDPHAKNFVSQQTTRKLLLKQDFITRDDDIKVRLCEFNMYRDYLRTLFIDDVNQTVKNADELFKKEREQLKLVTQYESYTEGRAASRQKKLDESKRITKLSSDFKRARLALKEQQREARLQLWKEEREQIYMGKVIRNAQRGMIAEAKRKVMREADRMAAIRTLRHAALKDFRALERKKADTQMIKRAHEHYMFEWIESKFEQSRARLLHEQNVSNALRESLKQNGEKRQRRIEVQRKHLPQLIQQRKERQAKLWELVRKYFYIWLKKTRERKLQRADHTHESAWANGATGTGTLDESVKYLRFQTDTYQTLDNFILSILRLKEAIKKQLELEGSAEGDDDEDEEDEEEGSGQSKPATKAPSGAHPSSGTS